MIARTLALSWILTTQFGCGSAPPAEDPNAAQSGAPSNDAPPRTHKHPTVRTALPLPGTSVYHLNRLSFTDERGATFDWSSLRGEPALVVMFYGSCTTACPILLRDAARVDAAVDSAVRGHLRIVFITIDPERDTTDRLQELVHEHHLETPRWTLLRGSPESTRRLAVVLGVQYRLTADGEYAHSALLSLLDADGTIVSRIEGLSQPVEDLSARASALAAASHAGACQ